MVKRVHAIQTIDASDLVKKSDYDTIYIYITIYIHYSESTAKDFPENLKWAELATKEYIAISLILVKNL